MLTSIRNVKFYIKMRWNTMFITAVCVIFLIKFLSITLEKEWGRHDVKSVKKSVHLSSEMSAQK